MPARKCWKESNRERERKGGGRQEERKKNRGISKEHRSHPESTPNSQSWNTLSKKINNIVLNYNPKSKTNVVRTNINK